MKSFLEDDFKPNIKSQISDLRDLDGPGDVEDDLDAILDDAEQILDKVTIDVFKQDEDPFADVNDRFTTLGLTECSDSE